IHGIVAGAPPACDLDAEKRLIDALLETISGGVAESAHDCSDGGLAVALAECCVMDRSAQFGATVDLSAWPELPDRALLFGEAQARVVVSTRLPDSALTIARKHGVPARAIGKVGAIGGALEITTSNTRLSARLVDLDDAYHESIPRIMSQAAMASS